jgi:hypothetical protein
MHAVLGGLVALLLGSPLLDGSAVWEHGHRVGPATHSASREDADADVQCGLSSRLRATLLMKFMAENTPAVSAPAVAQLVVVPLVHAFAVCLASYSPDPGRL